VNRSVHFARCSPASEKVSSCLPFRRSCASVIAIRRDRRLRSLKIRAWTATLSLPPFTGGLHGEPSIGRPVGVSPWARFPLRARVSCISRPTLEKYPLGGETASSRLSRAPAPSWLSSASRCRALALALARLFRRVHELKSIHRTPSEKSEARGMRVRRAARWNSAAPLRCASSGAMWDSPQVPSRIVLG